MDKTFIILAGHYGSGKTNLAINLAVTKKTAENAVTVVDLDIINPYFRLADGDAVLREKGIKTLCPVFANTNVDIPVLPPELSGVFSASYGGDVVVDVGGDEAGAIALGRYAGEISDRRYQMLLVVNKYRPFTTTASGSIEVMEQIMSVSRQKFTGIAANPNLGRETTAETVLSAVPYYEELSQKTGLPITFTAVREDLCGQCASGIPGDVFPIKIYSKPGWEIY